MSMTPDEEDDRTIVRPKTVSPAAVPDPAASAPDRTVRATHVPSAPTTGPGGATVQTSQHTMTLPPGVRLAEFEVTQTIGEGGFGIVYLAWDHSLQRKVALKEYMPSALAYRVGQTEIRARSERHQETFEAGLKSFVNEARLLAQFDHPSLLKVYRFWEANGTAYMVMPFLEGATLRDTVRGLAEPPGEAWIVSLLAPLCDALGMLHAAQCFHRDIAPDNILLLADGGRPLLLDFGAARRVIGDMTQALTAILKPGYAPVEQYAEVPGLKQGAWTDVYALAAVVHWMVTGKTPSPSVGRMFDNSHVPLVERAAGRYSPGFLAAVDRALAVMPDDRTQTIEAFRDELVGGAGAGSGATAAATAVAPAVAATTAASIARTTGPATRTLRDERTRQAVPPTPAAAPSDSPQAPASRRWLVAAAIAVLAAAAAIGAYLLVRPAAESAAVAPTAREVAPAPVATEPAPPATPASAIATVPDAATTNAESASATAAAPAPIETAPAPASVEAATEPKPSPKPRETEPARTPARKAPVVRAERPAEPTRSTPTRTEPTRSEPTREPPQAEPRHTERASGSNEAECARLFQRLSIGESSPDLIERVRTLRCR